MSGPDVRLVRTPGEAFPRSIIGEARFGYPTFISASLPERLWTGVPPAQRVLTVRHGDREAILTTIASPAENYLLCAAEGVPVEATRAALRRLEALWLLVEDEHRLLDAERIEPLAHQASLVKHDAMNHDCGRAQTKRMQDGKVAPHPTTNIHAHETQSDDSVTPACEVAEGYL